MQAPALLHFLVPCALLPKREDVRLPSLPDAPALQTLLARAARVDLLPGDAFQRTLPHERWAARTFGLNLQPADADDAPLAPFALLADGGVPGDSLWACVEPVHVQIAHDHLVLIDPRSLALPAHEARTLLDAVQPMLAETGVQVQAPTPLRWYFGGDALGALASASPLRAAGRNIEIWLPHEAASGARSRAWMKLQNEVQMTWFEHPVNEAREARGLPAANSIWLHGQGRLRPVSRPFSRVLAHDPVLRGLALAGQAHAAVPGDDLRASGLDTPGASGSDGAVLVELDGLVEPFIQQDLDAWSAALRGLDTAWFAPALAALHAGTVTAVRLTLTGEAGAATYQAARADARKFWRTRRTLAAALAD